MKVYNNIIEKEAKQYIVYEEINKCIVEVEYYKSGWGNEYRKVKEEYGRHFFLEETKGRSSATCHPFLKLTYQDGSHNKIVIGYSGNWNFELETTTKNTWLKVSIENYKISPKLYIPNVYILDEKESVKDLYTKRDKDKLLNSFPISYNHWWAYEDQNINQDLFLENAIIAKNIGAEYAILDAGWFGADDEWMKIRGDWNKENTNKFVDGIAKLSKNINDIGLGFGIWIEVEAIGSNAKLKEKFSNYIAEINGEKTDLLCFGNKEVVDWAFDTISTMLDNYNAKWLKMDFNIDPMSGCTSTCHDHDPQSGNQAHITGLYNLITKLQDKHPNVIFENCSSGGQRSDFKIIDLFDVNFLSDADYIEHKTRCFKNSKELMPNYKNYHFIPSMTVTEYDSGFRSTDYRKLSKEQIIYNLMPSLYGLTGISHRLVEYDTTIINVLKNFFKEYNKYKSVFIANNEPRLIHSNDIDIVLYKKGNAYLCGIMSHCKQELKLDKLLQINIESCVDLLTKCDISNEIGLEKQEGMLLLINGE